jgi:hypothetical protein
VPPKRLLVAAATALTVLVGAPLVAASVAGPTNLLGVRLAQPARINVGPLSSGDGRQAAAVLHAANRYALTVWWPQVAPALLSQVTNTPASVNGRTDAVRRLGMEGLALATALKTGGYTQSSGATAASATATTVKIVQVLVSNHASHRTKGWGGQWQATLWESLAARTAWLMWSDLPVATRLQATQMISWQADAAARMTPLYLRNAQGRVIRTGNSAAEENSWNALPLQVATAVLPSSAHWKAWRHAELALELSSWSRPQDVGNDWVVNGASYATWVKGSNLESDGTIVNHSRIAPDYATNLYQNVDALLIDALAGIPAPLGSRVGLKNAYASFTQPSFHGKGFAQPGGTIYQGSSIYYPQGCDWGRRQQLPFALVDAQAQAFGFGNSTSATYAARHLNAELQMQSRFSDGRTFRNAAEYSYIGREEHSAQLAAQLYQTLLIRDHHLSSFTDESFYAPGAPLS